MTWRFITMFTLAQKVKGSTLTLHNIEFCLWYPVVRCTPSDWTEGPPLIGTCQRLPIQYICNNPPYLEVSSSAHTVTHYAMGPRDPFNIVQKPNSIYLHLHYTCCLFYLPELILVDSPSAKVSTMVARSLAAEDEIADKSVWGSRNAWTTTESSPAGVDEDWLSPVTATIASARATDKTLSAIASAACYRV